MQITSLFSSSRGFLSPWPIENRSVAWLWTFFLLPEAVTLSRPESDELMIDGTIEFRDATRPKWPMAEAWAGPTMDGFETASLGRGRTITIPLVVPATRKLAIVVKWDTPKVWLFFTVNALELLLTIAIIKNYSTCVKDQMSEEAVSCEHDRDTESVGLLEQPKLLCLC